jgi:leucine dehydrogenase
MKKEAAWKRFQAASLWYISPQISFCPPPLKSKKSIPLRSNLKNVKISMTQATENVSHEGANIFNQLTPFDHEEIVFCNDNATGLKAIICIHNTVLGPGLGGTRFYNYANDQDAITDVLRLARGMSFKSSIAGLNLGGAKAVIVGDPAKLKSEAFFRKFGRFIENLNGKYITAEDIGTTMRDMEYIKMETDHVVGLPEIKGGGGDPSPVTAYGVYMGMKASAKETWGSDSLAGKRISVQGIGKVGEHLVDHLTKEGAKVYISDVNQESLARVSKKYNAEVVAKDSIYGLDVDIFAPCAMGAILNNNNIEQIKAAIVCGAANNQLADEHIHGKMLSDKNIHYAPDFLVNSGGIINVYSELIGYNRDLALAQTENIYNQTLEIFKKAKDDLITTHQAALQIAEKRIRDYAKVKSTY